MRHVIDDVAATVTVVEAVVNEPGGDAGGTAEVTYRFTITNTGNATLDDLTLVDDKIGPMTLPVTSLAPGETITVEATYTLTAADIAAGEVENVAIVRGTDADGTQVSDQDDEVVRIDVRDEVEAKPTVLRRQLPRTGIDGQELAALGLLLASVGLAALLLTSRRRRRA